MVRSLVGKHPQYYEAVLQLRDTSPEVVDFVKREIENKRMPVAKFMEVKNGYDYYLADNAFTKALGKKIQEKFGGQILFTSSLHTQKDSKELHRGTVLYRGISFKKGDLIEYNDEEYKVRSVVKEISLQHVKTGKKINLKYKDMKMIKNKVKIS